eukprot:1101278_1
MASQQLLAFVYVLMVLSLAPCIQSACFDCFGFRSKRSKRPPKAKPLFVSVPSDECSGFDNCLLIAHDVHHPSANDSSNDRLSPQSSMLSTMQSHNYPSILSLHTIGNLPDYQPDLNVNWFNVSSHFITQNDTIIKSNMNIFLVQTIVYDISHVLYFLGHYLPSNNTAMASQYQLIFNYFTQFQHGFKRVNLHQVMKKFESIREKVTHLLKIHTHTDTEDVDSP